MFTLQALPEIAFSIRGVAEGYDAHVARLDRAADRAQLELRLRPRLRHQEAVVVAAHREEVEVGRVPRTVAVLTAADLRRMMPRTTPEALMDLPGVLVQKTNHGGGSPYIRGLVGNHVIVLVDGVRLNNATFRYGPNQYLATIDPAHIERIEVLRGSGSVLFGSDAVGGVINIVTKRPVLSDGDISVSGEASGKLVSSGMERAGRADLSVSGSRAGIIGGVSVGSYGDLHAGGDLGVERPSGYSEVNADVKGMIRLSARSLVTVALQQVYQDDVPRYDQVAQRGFERYSFDPQIRRLGYARWELFGANRWARSVTSTVSFHQSVERRDHQRRGSLTRTIEQDAVGVFGSSIQLQSTPYRFWSIVSGLDYTHDRVGSWRRDTNVVTSSTTARRGLYPDGATADSAAVFTHSSLRLGATTLDAGVRFGQHAVDASDGSFGTVRIQPRALVGSIAAIHDMGAGISVLGSVSQAFRAPNVDDVSTLGAFDFGVEVPSPALDPERSVAFEGGIRLNRPRTSASLVWFRTHLSDLIDRVRGTFNGSDLYEGQRVYQRANVGNAMIHGAETELRWSATSWADLFGHVAYTYGQQTTTDQPMRRIPPLNGLVGVRVGREAGQWMEGTVRFAGKQERLAPGDRDDHRIPPGGTPGWAVVDVDAGMPLSGVQLVGGVQNLFNEAYRVHGSGIDGYGRSAWLGCRIGF
jgi:outer membrane receptor protein involved in Fe transport